MKTASNEMRKQVVSTMTRDFSGEYDYPLEEALTMAEHYKSLLSDGETLEYLQSLTIKEKAYWLKSFGDDEQGKADLARFIEVFNRELSTIGIKIN